MFSKLLNPENGLMITFSQIGDCIFLSLFWFLGALPVLTLGASTAALYDAVYRSFRLGDKHSWRCFWEAYRKNCKESLLPNLIFLGLFFLGLRLSIVLWNGAVYGSHSWGLFAAGAFFAMLLLGTLSVLFPLLSRFENPLGRLLKNTVLLALANLPGTLLLGFLNGACIFLCLRYVFPLFFLPALVSLLSTLPLERMFRPFLPKEAQEGAD